MVGEEMKYKVGDRVYSKTFKEKGVIDHINMGEGKRNHWIKPEDKNSIHWIASSSQIKPIITLKAELA